AAEKVSVYAACARGVQAAATNWSHDSRAALTTQAASGTTTSAVRYRRVNPRLTRNPGSTRWLTWAMIPFAAGTGYVDSLCCMNSADCRWLSSKFIEIINKNDPNWTISHSRGL